MRIHTSWALAITACCLPVSAIAASSAPGSNPGATMLRIASQPFRYGGELQGTVPGLQDAIDPPTMHLSMGLSAPAADGSLHGEAILFRTDRRLIAEGMVSGRLVAGPTAGTGECTLHLTLPTQDVVMQGVCTAGALSGEIVSQPRHVGLLTRLATWWGDRAVAGRYWLTPASFDPADRSSSTS
ncbi:hypothetical protein HN018_21315 [Lichenicola cladoniae]|uniref:Uncharacterized protein n=1 Tax=Lichenicola cladoniae TaxID=1484109 RepID=A0A6M8HVN7_9PROT|nr:hypothetical protein [Lichenicola cladoniae]NPD69380.1 hypothetical protein [Acetobacteraceae bacterium]QKE92235.1 hypothetical protein HN018_21315 [Lichenicola cladoniae]